MSVTGPKLKQAVNKQQQKNTKCSGGCKVCPKLAAAYTCRSKLVVYCYTCSLCGKMYVGETARPMGVRHKEHTSSIVHKNCHSALSEHLLQNHNVGVTPSIDVYQLSILRQCQDSKETCIAEAITIQQMQPELNRKTERHALW